MDVDEVSFEDLFVPLRGIRDCAEHPILAGVKSSDDQGMTPMGFEHALEGVELRILRLGADLGHMSDHEMVSRTVIHLHEFLSGPTLDWVKGVLVPILPE